MDSAALFAMIAKLSRRDYYFIRRIAEARQNINALTAELKSIQTDEVYRLLQSLKTQNITWEEHFAQIKKNLQNQLSEQNDN